MSSLVEGFCRSETKLEHMKFGLLGRATLSLVSEAFQVLLKMQNIHKTWLWLGTILHFCLLWFSG